MADSKQATMHDWGRDMVKDESQVAGPMSDPLVCVSLDGCTVKEVIDEAARANLGNADLVEVRFDRLYLVRPKAEEVEGEDGEIRKIMPPEDEWSRLAVADVNTAEVIEELKGGIPLPVIFTCRPVSEGGFFPGDEDERCGILDAAISSGVSYVDLELLIEEGKRQEMHDAAKAAGVKIIASVHGEGVPGVEDIVAQIEQNASKGDTVKMCWTTESQQESLRLVEASWSLKGEGHDFALMGLGPGGDWTRLHAPVLDQSLVYATLQNDFHLGDRGLVNVKDLRNAWILMEY